jgi:hypothetical protein
MMKKKEDLIDVLEGIESPELIRIIDEDYYRSMIACKPADTTNVIDGLITELVNVQEGCAKAERYDLAIICRTKLTELAMQMKLEDLI